MYHCNASEPLWPQGIGCKFNQMTPLALPHILGLPNWRHQLISSTARVTSAKSHIIYGHPDPKTGPQVYPIKTVIMMIVLVYWKASHLDKGVLRVRLVTCDNNTRLSCNTMRPIWVTNTMYFLFTTTMYFSQQPCISHHYHVFLTDTMYFL